MDTDTRSLERRTDRRPTHRIAYWGERGRRIDWIEPYTRVASETFDPHQPVVRWFEDGSLNVAANCLDRFAALDPDAPALFFEAADPARSRVFTRGALLEAVARLANVLKAYGVTRGERVLVYLPNAPEAVIAMLAAARIGAVHVVVFTGYSGRALMARMRDCGARVVVTADAAPGPDGPDRLKEKVDVAASGARGVETVIVARILGEPVEMVAGRDVFLDEVADRVAARCPPVEVGAEHPLFLAYTMGVTGRPKGLVHASGGFLVHVAETLECVLGAGAGDVVWCTADVAHPAAHAYAVYGPLANGAATVIAETPAGPRAIDRLAGIVAGRGVSVLYATPALLRDVLGEGPGAVDAARRALGNLSVLGTHGEAISGELADVLRAALGGRVRTVETWWQTESGGILLAGEAGEAARDGPDGDGGRASLRPVASAPVALADEDGRLLAGAGSGELVMTASWPGQARTIHEDHLRYAHVHFARFPGLFRTGDSAVRDAAGGYRVVGRIDDVLHIAGHRLAAEEIERALSDHRAVVEAAVVALPRTAAARGLCAFVALAPGVKDPDRVKRELAELVRVRIGDFATPAVFRLVRALPRSRSGKLVRRILRQVVAGTYAELEDRATLADPTVLDDLVEDRGLLLPG